MNTHSFQMLYRSNFDKLVHMYGTYGQYDYDGHAFPFTAKLGNKLGIQFTECCI